MSTIPKQIKKAWYKRWWVWTLFTFFLLGILGVFLSIGSYQESQRESYLYLTEKTAVKKKDLQKTISANGVTIQKEVIAEQEIIPEGFENLFTAEEPIDLEAVTTNDILARLDQNTIEKIIDVTESAAIEFYASDAEILLLDVGQQVAITIPAYDGGKEEFFGEILSVSRVKETPNVISLSSPSSESGYRVVVSSDALPKKVRTITGLSVDMVIQIDEKKNVLAIEPGAIQYDENDKPFVYLPVVIDDAFIARAQEVSDITELLEKKVITMGFVGDEYIEVLDGLSENEDVLIYIPQQGSDSPFGI